VNAIVKPINLSGILDHPDAQLFAIVHSI
jgi:hypothetical protein